MIAEEFTRVVGRPPEDDDLERANCPYAGAHGHLLCGVCKHGLPLFMCGPCICSVSKLFARPHHGEPIDTAKKGNDMESKTFSLGAGIGECDHLLVVSLYVDSTGRDILKFNEYDRSRSVREVNIPVIQIINARVTL